MLDKINQDLITAMRAKDKMTLSVLRLIKAAIERVALDSKRQLTDDEVISVINKQIKMRQDSKAEFAAGERQDLVVIVDQELAILKNYMPELLSEQEIEMIVIDAINQTGVNSIKDLGKVMKEITPKVKGRSDMSKVTELVKKNLST